MFLQYEGELYLLAADQGYLNQPNLVWEKLNKVYTILFSFKWTESIEEPIIYSIIYLLNNEYSFSGKWASYF